MDFELIGTIAKKQRALHTILQQMNVPVLRQNTTRKANQRWLMRNLAVQNKEHAMFDTAMELIKWLIKNQPEGAPQ